MKYPIGLQNFEKIIKEDYLYIDKTELLYKMVTDSGYYFLSRPRRFGKSLLVSTLEAYFMGKRELFKGLAIENLEKDWKKRPVFHLDLNTGNYDSVEGLTAVLRNHLQEWEEKYGRRDDEEDVGLRFKNVVQQAYEQSGERVAILIDEYDKPLLNNIGNNELQEQLRSVLRTFYSVLKTQDRYIQFGLLTGVSKFGKLSVFSDLNSPKEISMDARYVELCGITEAEIHKYLSPQLHEMAEKHGVSYDEMMLRLRKRYDGYHFEVDTVGIYNPYSLLCAFDSMTLKDYWFETGTPSFLVNMLQRSNYKLDNLTREEQTGDVLNSIDTVDINPIPLLFQSGYLTIKGYDERFRMYRLGFPNEEVENGFVNYIVPFYSPMRESGSAFFIQNFTREIESGDIDSFMERLQTLYEDNSYTVQGKMELYFQNTMYVVFKLLGFYVDIERTTSRGRIDMIVKTNDFIYVIEIKLDGTAEEALKQIEDKGYAKPYANDPRQLYKIGINFSSETRSINDWKVCK